ncbi:ATP-dependent helicase HrpB [Meridianimarinicoccus roseus]|uniref:ATP-dependent helicase HrpB n=1 Tax=Meridianimarinicoccus roseus TaxID=2072018 RepID=A0A2V2LE07_9RHOB|nr:ATP-dependent helicase HrpB [Meridianimarinicoccus roseus]PWR01536.1 ATP-dependent helicase HrpB [Meridianimarinicoccus roseus]
MTRSALPIDPILPDLVAALAAHGRAVLQAPPGAGKTTRVPPALLAAGAPGRILMLEPRRLAARASAERMAAELGEPVGRTVGYTMRGEARVSAGTRIEVVTEGILTRRLQADPGLDGVSTLIFDEFHERSLQADLGLALAWEVRGALRPDLRLLVMSATLDAAPVAALLDAAPVLTAQGRAFPVDTRWLDTPPASGRGAPRLPEAAADLTCRALGETEGGVLVFLPGEAEIRRCLAALTPRLPADCIALPLYGALPAAAQRDALAPAAPGLRKIVLATAIAETSLTIDGIRVVVDAGRARRARFDPGSGMSRLVTERVTRAEAEQRRGRAGRVAPGICYRMWTRGAEGALAAFPPAEIEAADLTGLALELAQWGAGPEALAFLTPPPAAALAEAQALLTGLGALDAAGRITDHGRALAALPLHPRLGHMLTRAGAQAAPLAALLGERDPLRAPQGCDLDLRLRALRQPGGVGDPATCKRIAAEARRLARRAPATDAPMTTGEMAALAYPDRIALHRPGDAPRFVLSGGKGAALPEDDPLAAQRLLAVTDLDGDPREARIRRAAPLSESSLRALFADRIEAVTVCAWSRRERRVTARVQERLGALVLSDRAWSDAPDTELARAALDGVRELGLGLFDGARGFTLLRARLAAARAARPDLPDPSDVALLEQADDWLLPFLGQVRSAADLRAFDPTPALRAALDFDQAQALDRLAPPAYTTPLGRRIPIDYSAERPEIALRLQELFGETRHPQVGGQPLRVTLLSPAGRPVQTTMDLPGFWAGSYADVRKDMRARYPRHPWPEDPTRADPTLRAKPRGR